PEIHLLFILILKNMKAVSKVLFFFSIITFMACHNLFSQKVSIGYLHFKFTDTVSIKELGDQEYEFAYGGSKTLFRSTVDNFSDSVKSECKVYTVKINFEGEFTGEEHQDGFDPTNRRTLA